MHVQGDTWELYIPPHLGTYSRVAEERDEDNPNPPPEIIAKEGISLVVRLHLTHIKGAKVQVQKCNPHTLGELCSAGEKAFAQEWNKSSRGLKEVSREVRRMQKREKQDEREGSSHDKEAAERRAFLAILIQIKLDLLEKQEPAHMMQHAPETTDREL